MTPSDDPQGLPTHARPQAGGRAGTGEAAVSPNPSPARIGTQGEGEKEEEGSSLLQFVTEASGGIKAALIKSAPSRRPVDHRKYLERQVRKLSDSPPHQLNTDTPAWRQLADSANLSPGDHHQIEGSAETLYPQRTLPIGRSVDQLAMGEKHSDQDSKLDSAQKHILTSCNQENMTRLQLTHTDRRMCDSKSCCHPLSRVAMATNPVCTHDFDSDPLFQKVISSCGFKSKHTVSGNSPEQTGHEPGVPLRQRRLPASFWQEPDVPKLPKDAPGFLGHFFKYGNHMMLSCKDLLAAQGGVYPNDLSPPRLYHPAVHGLHSAGYDPSLYETLWQSQSRYAPVTTELAALSHFGPRWPTNTNTSTALNAKSLTATSSLLDTARLHHLPHDLYPNRTVAGAMGYPATSQNTYVTGASGILDSMTSNSRGITLGSSRSQVWRPIPTKTMYPSRYHPFADVH